MVVTVQFPEPTDTSSAKSFLWIALAGNLETLDSRQSTLGAKIQLSKRSKFCIFIPTSSITFAN